jgi:hypothetical protein
MLLRTGAASCAMAKLDDTMVMIKLTATAFIGFLPKLPADLSVGLSLFRSSLQ